MIARKIIKPVNVIEKYRRIIEKTETIRSLGIVKKVKGNVVYSSGPDVHLGEICFIEKVEDEHYIQAEVTGFDENLVLLSPMEPITGIYAGSRIVASGEFPGVYLDENILGRVIDGTGQPLDKKGRLTEGEYRLLRANTLNPVDRPLIRTRLETGVRAIDSLLTLGQGQRIGIFSGSGVGKSTLLGMLARYSSADVNVIAMIGERGREVSEFIYNELGDHGMKKSVVVVASSNESPMHRVRAAYMATTIAEFFRDQGKNVLLMMDSLTRLALAQREIGLSGGEPAATRGYPPSVFSMLPELLERAGTSPKGTITGIYSVLVEGDDLNEPISDTVRGILDGHVVLSRRMASSGHYPAIDVVQSVSRLMNMVSSSRHQEDAALLRELLSVHRENEEIINLGAYVRGSNPMLDQALQVQPLMQKLLRQKVEDKSSWLQTEEAMHSIVRRVRGDGGRF